MAMQVHGFMFTVTCMQAITLLAPDNEAWVKYNATHGAIWQDT